MSILSSAYETYTSPPLVYRFAVWFMGHGFLPNMKDIFFQNVRGLSSSIKMYELEEGGENLITQRFPQKLQYDNLTLERGLAINSAVTKEFATAMATLEVNPQDVLITMMDENSIPVAAWKFFNAYPVKWNFSDLDANSDDISIQTLELAYSKFEIMSL